uniref:SWIM-type domain-containing protein n=1 Tax=viral metagenome TaxID=1070528 RepID=A0A6C0DZH0_9ZZZZ
MENAHTIDKRKLKSIWQNIVLQSIYCKHESDHNIVTYFNVIGASGNIYTITVRCDTQTEEIMYSCTCPDFCYRQRECKHLYWISKNAYEAQNPNQWQIYDILEVWSNNVSSWEYPHGRNDTCPICIDNIDYHNERTLCCISECYNSMHYNCWWRYNKASRDFKCTICRTYLI